MRHNITSGTRFSLSATASTTFSRPEDGAWDAFDPNVYYFVTTDRLDTLSDGVGTQVGQTRLWRLTFDDITNPALGGTIDLVIDGRTVDGKKVNMFDNITVNPTTGQIVLVEDVGGAAHNGKTWLYDPATDVLKMVAKHDPPGSATSACRRRRHTPTTRKPQACSTSRRFSAPATTSSTHRRTTAPAIRNGRGRTARAAAHPAAGRGGRRTSARAAAWTGTSAPTAAPSRTRATAFST